jgi:osmotically-inducible protein OsmY
MAHTAAPLLSPAEDQAQTIEAAPSPATQSVEDLRLAERVVLALRVTGYGPLRDMEVTVHARLVVLRGAVPSYYLKQVAQTITLAVPGAHRVRNELAVVRPK